MKTLVLAGAALALNASVLGAGPDLPARDPAAIVDLATREGIELVAGRWKYSHAHIVEATHRAPGADSRASGDPVATHDLHPKAGGADFDDSSWEVLDPTTLWHRRGTGKLCLCWYRLEVTIPQKVAGFDTAGSTVVLEMVVDDYAEVWVDGKLPQVLGQAEGALVSGWNAPQRVVLTRDARPGERVQVAILAANGPLSDPPGNFVWIRSATLDFYEAGALSGIRRAPVEIVRADPALDQVVPRDAVLEKLAEGFTFGEGPLWVPAALGGAGAQPIAQGYLLFSDPNRNVIHRWTPDGDVSIFRTKSGYTGANIAEYRQPGSNGLAMDREGRLTICEHGNRRVTRIEKNGNVTVLADRYEGRRLNSPNDLVYRSDGALFFTDPPFGLPGVYDDPRREQPNFGVYCLYNGTLRLVSADMKGPNGLAFSPDEKHLYVGNWDEAHKVVMRYDVQPDGALTGGHVFYDLTRAEGEEAIDGVKVDRLGNVYISGPGGVWIVSDQGRHLGTIRGPELPANFAWGDADRRTMYFTARTGLYRMCLNTAGAGSW